MSRHELVTVDSNFCNPNFVRNSKDNRIPAPPIGRRPPYPYADLNMVPKSDRPSLEQRNEPPSLTNSANERTTHVAAPVIDIHKMLPSCDPIIGRFVQTFMTELDRQPSDTQRFIAEAMRHAVSTHLLQPDDEREPVQPSRPLLSSGELAKIEAYIEKNIEQSIKLASLAAITKVSRSHFARLFKRSTGMTVMTFVEQCRVRRAQKLIFESDTPLVEIALMTGFSDQSHFTRRFCRRVGCTPAVFARENGHRRKAIRVS